MSRAVRARSLKVPGYVDAYDPNGFGLKGTFVERPGALRPVGHASGMGQSPDKGIVRF